MIVDKNIEINNSLLHMGDTLSLNEHKILNYIIYSIRKKLFIGLCLTTSVKNINEFIDATLDINLIENNLHNLKTSKIILDLLDYDKNKNIVYDIDTLIKDFDTKTDKGNIKIYIEPALKEIVFNIGKGKSNFTSINQDIINSFKSVYSIKLYQLCRSSVSKENRFVRVPDLTINQFRKLMGVDDSKYKQFSHFKSRVLEKATSEILHSDIIVKYHTLKGGNRHTHIFFDTKFKKNTLEGIYTSMEFLSNTELHIFLDDYLPRYADKKSVGLYNNNKIIYDKKTRTLWSEINIGVITFNRDTTRNILQDCYKNRGKFDWYNEDIFQQLVYEDKQQLYKNNFKR